jgi:tyrosine-protein phosphatase YwqE
MFSIFKKTPQRADLSPLVADMHSHLIPGIDDGSPDLETSLSLIRSMVDLGYQKIITTPHIMGEVYENGPDNILTGAQEVKQALKEEKIDVEFFAAAEYMLDDHFSSLLERDLPLLTIKDNMVLVEFSFVSAPMDYKQKIFSMQIKGYRPILAHPERYGYFHRNKKIYDELRNMGCIFQVNLLSLIGYYGKPMQDMAHHLVDKGEVSLLGTDLHHAKHIDLLHNPALSDVVNEILDTHEILNSQL